MDRKQKLIRLTHLWPVVTALVLLHPVFLNATIEKREKTRIKDQKNLFMSSFEADTAQRLHSWLSSVSFVLKSRRLNCLTIEKSSVVL